MRIVLTFLLYIVFSSFAFANAGHYSVSGKVVDDVTQKPLSYATIRIQNMELWAISDDNGKFLIANIPTGQVTVEVKTLGYVTRTFTFALNRDARGYRKATPVEVYIKKGIVVKVVALKNEETVPYFKCVRQSLLPKYANLKVSKAKKLASKTAIDGCTGATFSTSAVQKNIKVALDYYEKHK